MKVILAKNVHEKQNLSPLVTLAKNDQDQAKLLPLVSLAKNDQDQPKLSPLVTLAKYDQEKTKAFTVGIFGQKRPRPTKTFTAGILGQKWQRKNENFHHWYPSLKRLKNKKIFTIGILGQKCSKSKTFTVSNLGQIWPRKTKTFTFGNLGQKQSRLFFRKRVKFALGQCLCDISTVLAFQGYFSSNDYCTNVLICFNLWLACARNLSTEKRKKILRRGSSTEIIDIFTFARNPLGTAEADILTLLHNFCNNF